MISRRQFTIVSGATALAGHHGARAQSGGKIVLGQSAPFTGPAAQLGIQFNRGANVWFDQINAQGGIAGRLKRYGLSIAAGLTFVRLYFQPTQRVALPATIRLQPAW